MIQAGKPVKTYSYDVTTKQWSPTPRFQVGPDGVLDVNPVSLSPTAATNPSLVLAYDGSNQLTTVTKTINGVQYQKTLTWTNGILTAVSVWVQL